MTHQLKSVVMHKGSLREAYRHLPRSVWSELNRLKREERFSDMPHDATPGDLVLRRYVESPTEGRVDIDLIVVDESGEILRMTQTLPQLVPVPRLAA